MYNVPIARKVLLGLAAVALGVSTAGAEQRFEITPMAGFRDGGSFDTDTVPADIDGDASYALALNMAAGEGGQYELFYSRQASGLKDLSVDVNTEYLHLGGTTPLGDGEGVEPYAAMGIGATRFTPKAALLDDATRWSLSLGGGVKIPLGNYFAVRLEVRGYLTWLNGKTNLFCASDEGATCLVRGKGETLFQYEALGGVAFRF